MVNSLSNFAATARAVSVATIIKTTISNNLMSVLFSEPPMATYDRSTASDEAVVVAISSLTSLLLRVGTAANQQRIQR